MIFCLNYNLNNTRYYQNLYNLLRFAEKQSILYYFPLTMTEYTLTDFLFCFLLQ